MKWLEDKIYKVVHHSLGPLLERHEKTIKDLNDKVSELKKDSILQATALKRLDMERVTQKNLDDARKAWEPSFCTLSNDITKIFGLIEEEKKNVDGALNMVNDIICGSIKKLNEEGDFIKNNLNDLGITVLNLSEIKDRMDDGIVLMTKAKLLQLIDQKIEVFEGNINNKMSGLMIYVNDKAQAMQSDRLQDVDLLKKLARLEGENGS